MYAIEFKAVPQNGMVLLPKELSELDTELKFIVLTDIAEPMNQRKILNKFTALSINTKNVNFDREQANER